MARTAGARTEARPFHFSLPSNLQSSALAFDHRCAYGCDMAIRAWLRDLFGIVPTLDLHGFKVAAALDACDSFLREAQDAGVESVKIIYGKGNRSPGGVGVLRQVVPHWLEHDGAHLVARYERLMDSFGGDGAVRVWLKPSR